MMAVAVGNERQFANCAEVLGHPEWATDARFATNRTRVENRTTIDGLINAALSREKAEHWLARLKAVGVPCGRINSVAEALDDPHTAARAMVETVEHPAIGALKTLGVPFKFSDTGVLGAVGAAEAGGAQRGDTGDRAGVREQGDCAAARGGGGLGRAYKRPRESSHPAACKPL